jgi:hypothetical protein
MITVSLPFSRKKTPNDNRYSRKQDVIRDCGYFAKTYINICYYPCMYVGSSKVPRIRPEPLEPKRLTMAPWSLIPGAMEAHLQPIGAHPGAMESHPKAMDAHHRAVKAQLEP